MLSPELVVWKILTIRRGQSGQFNLYSSNITGLKNLVYFQWSRIWLIPSAQESGFQSPKKVWLSLVSVQESGWSPVYKNSCWDVIIVKRESILLRRIQSNVQYSWQWYSVTIHKKKKTATRLDPWEILWRYRCPPASPIKGFGTERARLGTIIDLSKNCRVFPQKEKKAAQNMKFWLKN